jgi:GTPase SAR1 family protein
LVCFSVINRASFDDVEYVWVEETGHFCPGVPWLLIGTRIDQRGRKDPKAHRKWNQPITTKEGRAMAKRLGASAYIECSALEQINVKEVFEQVGNRIFHPGPVPVHSSNIP